MVCRGPEPYRRVMGFDSVRGQAADMISGRARIGSLALALSLALSVSAFGPAAAVNAPRSRDQRFS